MTTLESFFTSLGLLWERLHIISAGTVQTAGISSTWMQDLVPIGDRVVAAGELVELRVTLDKDHPVADSSKIRFDILEFDWLFSGGFDDPVASLKPPAADAPDGAFTIVDRLISESDISAELPTLRDVVDEYRTRHAVDYERGILVVRDAASGVTDVIAWWRAVHVPESGEGPSLYFVAEIPGRRSSSTAPLRVDKPAPGVNVRLSGLVRDTEPAALADAQPAPDAVVTLAHHTARTTAAGEFVLDGRVPLGSSTVTISRPGIDTRSLTVVVTERSDHGYDVAVLDADAGNAQLDAGTIAANADDQAMVASDLTLRARVHRLSGTVVWPQTWTPQVAATPLAGRYVYAIPLAAGAALPQRPATSRDWEALRSKPGVLRSALPGRPKLHEATDGTGAFEICFIDLRPGSQHLLWVEGDDPRAAGTRVCDVMVRTVDTPSMRRLAFPPPGALAPEHTNRKAVDSTYNLLADDVSAATEVLRVVNTAAANAPADLRVQRPGRVNPAGFDANPVTGVDLFAVELNRADVNTPGLQLEVLPLVPVFESADRQGEHARWAIRTLHERLDGKYPRGYLLDGLRWEVDATHPLGHPLDGLRWVLDARRGPTAPWNGAAACAALETTLLTHPKLGKDRIDSGHWPWWRADAVSAADFAQVALGANATFAGRTLGDELVPILTGPVPRLLALFPRRHVHLSPGHGVYAQPPIGYAFHTPRPDWASTYQNTPVQNWAGEDENAGGLAIAIWAIGVVNGASVTSTREAADPTRLGWAHDGGAVVEVNPVQHPDHPRLWQQNAYYWIAAQWDPHHAGAEIVIGHEVTNPAKVGQNHDTDPIDAAAINGRLAVFKREANGPGVDAFVALHTDGALAPATRGYKVMYLDVRDQPNSPDPGTATYVERNVNGARVATKIGTALASTPMPQAALPPMNARNTPGLDSGVRSYWVTNGSTAREIATTVHHFSNGISPRSLRCANPAGNATLSEVLFVAANAPDVPVGYLELGFHSSPEDTSCLSQGWFRSAAGEAIAMAIEDVVTENGRDVSEDDVVALLRRTFGSIPAVRNLAVLPGKPDAARVAAQITAVTGHAPGFASPALGAVVAAIETERAAVTRALLASRVANAVALRAGWTAAAAEADDRAWAAYAPVLHALGAPAPAGVPDIAAVPRGDRPATRADVAAVLGAALGLRPASLATVTAPINGVTVLPAAVPEQPEAFVGTSTLDASVTALGTLRPVDVLHLDAVRLVDARGAARPLPYRVAPGEQVVLVVETIGTPWRGGAADVTIVVARAAATVATLGCTTRAVATLTSAPWTVALTAVAGPQPYDVTVQIKHPTDATRSLGPLQMSLEVAAS